MIKDSITDVLPAFKYVMSSGYARGLNKLLFLNMLGLHKEYNRAS